MGEGVYLEDTEGVGDAALEAASREALEVGGESSLPYREEYLVVESSRIFNRHSVAEASLQTVFLVVKSVMIFLQNL